MNEVEESPHAHERLGKHTPEPWRWEASELGPQLEGANYASEMNPVLIAHGCGNKRETSAGIKGCLAWEVHKDDPLRACPLHPHKADRDRIVACVNALAGIEDPAAFVAEAKAAIAKAVPQ